MLIDFNGIVQRHGRPNGVIHIGAHLMEERPNYISHGLRNTIWAEANPGIFENTKNMVDKNMGESIHNFAISDVDDFEYEFNITNNGQSSSILELDKHKTYHPNVYVTEVIKVKSKRMDTLINENSIDINDYDFINLDIQGAELLALKGFGKLLENIKYIYTEVNTNSVYKNCALIEEIDSYLKGFGFERKETKMTEFEWGDSLYVKI
jgi:FkbM family methyltransferase